MDTPGAQATWTPCIVELMDFRKINGASEVVLRGMTSTETYLKKARKTVSKMMRLQWTSDHSRIQGTLGYVEGTFGSCK